NTPAQFKPGEVVRLEFRISHEGTQVLVNDKTTARLSYAPSYYPAGAIGLHVVKGSVRVKKFEVSAEPPLDPAPPLPPVVGPLVPDGDFQPLFNGKDLTGWQPLLNTIKNWRVENGMLIGEGEETGMLHTVQRDFQDFHLRMEGRITAPMDAAN